MTPKNVRPRRDWCLVLPRDRIDRLSSGVYLPGRESSPERLSITSGTIICVGGGLKNEKLGLRSGIRVCFRDYLKHLHQVPGVEDKWPSGEPMRYSLIATDDIIAILDDTTEVGFASREKK